MIIEFSFDDGHILDLKVADLLEKYGFRATFYIVVDWVGTENHLTWEQIKDLINRGHTIGSHSMTHPMDMKLLYDDQLFFEVQTSKDLLERALGVERIKKFCFPRGRYNEKTIEAVKQAGYEEARTTKILRTAYFPEIDPFRKPTTIHVYQRKEYDNSDWLTLAKGYFGLAKEQESEQTNQYFHLWGHSREIERDKNWQKLEEFFKYANIN